MKKLFIILLVLFITVSATAQIDRTQQPKPGPAPVINLQEPQTFQLKNGLTVMVVENHKLPRVSIQLSIDNPPVLEGDKAGVQSLTGSLLGNGSKSISKDDFNEEIDFLGARLNFGATRAFASSLSKYFPRILELMADAAINPNFTQEEFDKEKAKLITGIKSQENDVSAIARKVQNALAYGTDNPSGEFTTEETVNNVSLVDVNQYYGNYFVPANAYLVIIGDVKFDQAKELATKNFTPWTKAVPPTIAYSEPKDVQYTQIDFVDTPNAVQSEIAVENLVNLKMKDDDYLDALIANRILGGGFQGRLNLSLREDKGYTYGARSSIRASKYGASTFKASTSVRNMVTDSSVVVMLNEIDKIALEPVSPEDLALAKAAYVGNFVLALESPQTIANYALDIKTQGLPKDFYKTYLERINAVTVNDVENAAKKYFSSDNARVVVVGKGSEVLDNLEKVKFKGKEVPVLFFDKNAKKTAKPNYDAAVPEGITANSVLEKYIEAIGGKAKIDGVTSYAMIAEAEAQGVKLELELKKTSKDQSMQDVRLMGTSMQKQVIDGDKGYVTTQGQRKDLSKDELAKLKEESAAFPELNYLTAGGVTLEGIEAVGDKKAYKLKVTDEKIVFYDVATGLKLQQVNTANVGGKQVQQTLSYGDYKEVSGIMFPFKITQNMGPQKFDFIVKEIKVNEGVSAADFE